MSKLKIYNYLKSVKRDMKPIIMRLSFGYKETNALTGKSKYVPLPYNTEIKIRESEWDEERQLPKERSKLGELLDLEDVIKNTYNHMVNQGVVVTPQSLKTELDLVLGREIEDNSVVYLTDFIEQVMEKDKTFSTNYKGQFKTVRTKLENFERNRNIRFTNLNFNRDHFLDFMEEVKNDKSIEKQNSVWKIQKNLTTCLLEINVRYRDKGVVIFIPTEGLSAKDRVQQVEPDKIYFEFGQIREILEYRSNNESLENVRKILLVLLFTGCRYSDVFKIKPEKLYSDKTIEFKYAHFITEKKPKTEIIMPILKPLQDMFDSNGGESPRMITGQKFNQYVKDLCQEIGMDEELKIPYMDAHGNKKFETKLLYQFVTSHIGRRSFVSNLIDDVPITLLSKITGHKFKDKQFKMISKYDKKGLLKSAVKFMKTLAKLSSDNDYKEEFPYRLA